MFFKLALKLSEYFVTDQKLVLAFHKLLKCRSCELHIFFPWAFTYASFFFFFFPEGLGVEHNKRNKQNLFMNYWLSTLQQCDWNSSWREGDCKKFFWAWVGAGRFGWGIQWWGSGERWLWAGSEAVSEVGSAVMGSWPRIVRVASESEGGLGYPFSIPFPPRRQQPSALRANCRCPLEPHCMVSHLTRKQQTVWKLQTSVHYFISLNKVLSHRRKIKQRTTTSTKK